MTDRTQASSARAETLQAVVEALAPATGQDFFRSLVEHLCRSLGVDLAVVGAIDPARPTSVQTLAYARGGVLQPDIAYEIQGTPCENILRQGFCHYPTDLQRQFPEDRFLIELGIDSYMGCPLFARSGEPLGLIAVLHHQPIPDPVLASTVIRVVAARAGAELERERFEDALQASERKLRESQRILETVMNNIPQGVFWKDRQSRYLGCNRVVSEAFGLSSPQAVVSATDFDFPSLTHEEAAFFVAKDREVIDRDQPEYGIVEPATLADGRSIWMETSKIPMHDDQGRVIGVLGTWQDITERKLLEEQLRQSQKMEAVGQLAAGVAHDFNNLLMVICGYSESLLAELPQGRHRELVAAISDAGEKAALLTRQLLTFSRKQLVHPQVLDPNTVIRQTQQLLQRLLGEDVQIETSLTPEAELVRVDPGQLEQVVINLSVNARDAMPTGGTLGIETETVELDADFCRQHAEAVPGRYTRLSVADTGTGMSPEVLQRIFEPFFTTKQPGKGTGLGLPTVYGIVKQCGGFIEVRTQVGQGTRFQMYFPAVGMRQAPVDERALAEAPGGSETILLVEDDEALRRLIRHVLESRGYTVVSAANGRDGLTKAAAFSGQIALVVSDVVMPEMSGRVMAERLHETQPGLKVLFLSGHTDDAVMHHGVTDANVPFLQKPISPAVLVRKVRELLDQPV